ncbi:MAG: hypothetical protein K0Q49_1640 [Haloplasmataceae bacterium]|nr:hypothetical protein [Haloplasmataceae bacterium]
MIRIKKINLIVKQAKLPALLTMISLGLFIVIYLFVTLTAVEPYYLEGLMFAVPFVIFGIITYFTVKGKLKLKTSNLTSIILIFVLGILMMFSFIAMSVDAAGIGTTDVAKYQRVLRITGYPNDKLTEHFPNKIPENAKNIRFEYTPSIFGSKSFKLKFELDTVLIDNYIKEFSTKAIKSGSLDELYNNNEIPINTFTILGYNELPDDFTVFKLESKGTSFVAISKQRNEIIFVAFTLD